MTFSDSVLFRIRISNKRKANFLAKLNCSDTVLTGFFFNVISMEVFTLQLNYVCIGSELHILFI